MGELLDLREKHQGHPVTDAEGGLAGVVTRSDLLRPGVSLSQTIGEIASSPAITCAPEDRVEEAVNRMAYAEIGHMPVVARDDPHRLVGWISRGDCLKARRRRFHEEGVPDRPDS
jgi:CIC family chloride channel protein